MAYDNQAHLKIDDLHKKFDALDKKLELLAAGLDVPLHRKPIQVAEGVKSPMPRWSSPLARIASL
ncbi:putative uncharacterized protein [Corynebacterium casei UCMA 3821]|uniref:Uncharacterized protein n=1 Tax=Corynebacterium casei UCMA 3821 TaxID=1110505 RepID=G7HU25_9CORY|nr:putative uncharacterized protein [Corynebacterium casei UCMA 3821]